MTTYEQQIIHGVPFLLSNSSVFYYDPLALPWSANPKEPIRIGTFTSGDLRLDAGWEERVKSRVDAWRATISPVGRNEVVRAPKQSKPKRSPKSAAKTAGTTGETPTGTTGTTATTNVVIMPTNTANTANTAAPEPTPKRVLKRRKVVQSNAP
jgi:hypothetical protein